MLKLNPIRLISGAFPIIQWSKSYDLKTAVGDFIAGITVALTLIPQSIAYASLAGFEPQFGLYASLVGGFIYGVLGTCPQINIGPTALLSLLTFTFTSGTNADFAVLLCFVGGIVQFVAGVVHLGFLVEFVSLPVVSGFTSAAAITIASSQIKGLLGLRFNAETFMGTWKGIFDHIRDTRMPDTLLSLACCIVLMGMKAIKDIKIKDSQDEKGQKTARNIQRCFWVIGVSRNAVVVVVAAVLAYFVHEDKGNPLILTGTITPGLPAPRFPAFQSTVGNTTYSAADMFSHLGSGLLVVPVVGIISNVAIAKAFARGKTLDATQEIVALGICNVVSAFFRSFPVNGSFTRSAVSDASGVKTPAAGFYTGIIVLLTLALLTPYFYFIPRAALASVIVCAVLHMVDIAIMKKLWATSNSLCIFLPFLAGFGISLVRNKTQGDQNTSSNAKRQIFQLKSTFTGLDLIPLLGSFICCLALGIEIGLICGVLIDMILLMYYHSRPPMDVQYVNNGVFPPYYVIHPVGGLFFAGAEKVRSQLASMRDPKKSPELTTLETLTVIPDSDRNGVVQNGVISANINNSASTNARKPASVLVVYCEALYRMDYTFLQSLKMLASEWSQNGRILWCGARPLVKEQLNSIIQDPTFCEPEDVGSYLMGAMIEDQQATAGDTQL